MVTNSQKIRQARAMAHQALALLARVEEQLRSARNWGIYDLLGGGFSRA